MYDIERSIRAYAKFNEKYSKELEYFASPMMFSPGRVLDILDYKIYAWPGHGISNDASGFQFIEGEYMTEDEYDDLIRDPSDFWIRKYLPRVFGILEPFKNFQPFTNITENVHIGQFRPLATPGMQESLQKLIEVGKEYQKTDEIMKKYMGQGAANGFPTPGSMFCKAPFDILGDTLRGTQGIMKDMFRRQDKLLEALDVIADITISTVLNSPLFSRALLIGYPLHKGADGWMSQKQFDTFYWPSLRKVMNAFIQEGFIQRMFAEGSFDTRIDSVNEFPRGTVLWYLDRSDIFRAKKILGKDCAIQGNIPISLIVTGSPGDVKDHCKKLIEECGKGGGYVLAAGTVAGDAKLENLQAVMEAVREFGFYKK
jgi:uroporphyrinogen-III decarboxylase